MPEISSPASAPVEAEAEPISEDEISEVPPTAQPSALHTRVQSPTGSASARGEPATREPSQPSQSPESAKKPEGTVLHDAPASESSSVGTSVADVDVDDALRQARRGRKTQVAILLSAAAIIVVGAGLGMHQQSGPEVKSSKADSTSVVTEPAPPPPVPAAREVAAPKVVVAPNPASAPPPEPEPAPLESVILRVHPLGAHIFEGNKKIAHTAATLKLQPNEKKILTLYLDGHWPRQVVVDGSDPEVNVSMKPKADTDAARPPAPAPAAQKANQAAPTAPDPPKKAQSSMASGPEDQLLPAL